MKYEDLSDEAKEVIKDMVYFCICNGFRMGRDEGLEEFGDCEMPAKPRPFRKELEEFAEYKR